MKSEVSSEGVDSESSEIGTVDVNCLKPTNLMVLEVEVWGMKLKGMIDSGASKTLMKCSLVQSPYLQKEQKYFVGLGGDRVGVRGEIEVDIKMYGHTCRTKVFLVEDACIRHDLILGVDFLTTNKFNVNMFKKKLQFEDNEGAITKISFNEEN